MRLRAWVRGERGLQTLEWIALALAALALLTALAIGLRQTEAGPGEAVSAAVSALFRCLTNGADCPVAAVGVGKAGSCLAQPTACLRRWEDCLLHGACAGADPENLLGLLPWLALVGIGLGGGLFALLPPSVPRRRWTWPRITFPPPRVPRGRPILPFRPISVRVPTPPPKPTPTCPSSLTSEPAQVDACAQELQKYGIYIDPRNWKLEEIHLILRGVKRMGEAMGGPENMKRAIGGVFIDRRAGGGAETYAFWPHPPWKRIVIGEATLHQEPAWRGEVAIVHELAHAWDMQSANLLQRISGRPGQIVREMIKFIGEEPGPTCYGGLKSETCLPKWRVGDPKEEWAESVSAYLYPEYIEFLRLNSEKEADLRPLHRSYVERQFNLARQSANHTNR